MTKCAYCGSPDVENKVKVNTWKGAGRQDVEFYYCSAGCRDEIEAFSAYVNRNAPRFLLGVFGLVLAMVLGSAVFPRYGLQIVGGATVLLGALIMVFPFATPETNRWLGIRKAVRTTRVLGGLVIGLGAAAAGLGVWGDLAAFFK